MAPTVAKQSQQCAKYQYVVTSSGPKIVPVPDVESKDEESAADYNSGGYLAVKVADTFKNDRYVVLRKLGWGHFSTVWLVSDKELNRHSALKVVKSAGRYAETARDEIRLLRKVMAANPLHPGREFVVSFLDSFQHCGPEDIHVCIVFEPLGENLLALIERNKKKGVPRGLVKVIAKQVLLGLQYLHEECDLVHTDIKPENIMIAIPDVEAHIMAELSVSPSPTCRRVGVPPGKTRAGVTIPKRPRERQVQIFDSQPLPSPTHSTLSQSRSSSPGARHSLHMSHISSLSSAAANLTSPPHSMSTSASFASSLISTSVTESSTPPTSLGSIVSQPSSDAVDHDSSRTETPILVTVVDAPPLPKQTGPSLLAQTAPHNQESASTADGDSTSTLSTSSTPTPPLLPPGPPPITIKIADLGNATPSQTHFTEDIQTRQYRAPEAILGRSDWGHTADIWSVACVVFELLTAEYLFDPQSQGEIFSKDDDHMAQIIELLGDFSMDVKIGGKYSREIFDSTGALRYIKSLKPWPLKRVMREKYLFTESDAASLCAFLERMLVVDHRKRASAGEMVNHKWLHTPDEAHSEEWL